MCVHISELPSNISTMIRIRISKNPPLMARPLSGGGGGGGKSRAIKEKRTLKKTF